MNNKKGFTLVELVVVIAIIAILAAVTVPSFNGYLKRQKAEECRTQQKALVLHLKSERLRDPSMTMEKVIDKYKSELYCSDGGDYSAPDNNTVCCSKEGHGETSGVED
ncbi:prepilin-type N-terminal cleavage/methylation domain-containing protein [Ohessyouella blattaphilus]|uniref:Prepilin-type N-terminal cleavage/methylation domain-containing protein n=1 Tax=Ohessyouella blattaphilus TaxID=2949333 RepID=A0ABT1EJU1_9FIRM|nr:prepilin-type N-terminal cleavage/methylation domain-containing protein [Ohessyouella blattaphilus]MCP1110955.1 prepilin-type N-terminal cleavage/methylation domain-containing protein [Ohessyouella blattaphilus]MCR8564349.1 prepilin-type N-terminal cleavage/methylation domain-containing protein [Ohessyouella blattaphilus]